MIPAPPGWFVIARDLGGPNGRLRVHFFLPISQGGGSLVIIALVYWQGQLVPAPAGSKFEYEEN